MISEALAEMLKPIVQKLLLEMDLKRGTQGEGTLSFVEVPDVDKLSSKEIIELYLKLQKGADAQ